MGAKCLFRGLRCGDGMPVRVKSIKSGSTAAKPATATKAKPAVEPLGTARVRSTPLQAKSSNSSATKSTSRYQRNWGRAPRLWFAAKALAALSATGAVVLVMAVGYTLVTMPAPQMATPQVKESGLEILAADGAILSGRAQAARYVTLRNLPTHLVDAVLATEDRRFYSHWGFDPQGLLRAGLTNLWHQRAVQGGSTITQQLAKNLFLVPKRTLARKAEELLYALALEVRYSKDEILELYLNRVYFGGGAYGIAAATDTYFGVTPEELSLSQSAMLAGLLKAPSRYSPTNSVDLATARAQTVLTGMAAAAIITPAEAARAKREPALLRPEMGMRAPGTGYAADWVAERLPHLITGEPGKLRVETTLDLALQQQAEAIVGRALEVEGEKLNVRQAAVVVLDNDGAVRAIVGGKAYAQSQFNRAVKARRQPGSAFKPFIYLAAVEAGLTPDTILEDAPFTVGDWTPRNYTGEYQGAVTARQALADSLNTVAVRLFQTAGRGAVVRTARRLGITSDLTDDASLALGTSELTPLELAGAYVPFANGGRAVTPHLIKRIRDAAGKSRYRYRAPQRGRLIDQPDLVAMTDMLAATLISGTAKSAALGGIEAAGKTGTTQDSRDAWFAGFTADFTAVVWVGNDDGAPMHKVTGGGLPARIWRDVMLAAHASVASRPLPGSRPAGAVAAQQAPDDGGSTTTNGLDAFLRALSN